MTTKRRSTQLQVVEVADKVKDTAMAGDTEAVSKAFMVEEDVVEQTTCTPTSMIYCFFVQIRFFSEDMTMATMAAEEDMATSAEDMAPMTKVDMEEVTEDSAEAAIMVMAVVIPLVVPPVDTE